jgi:hypothetical protein
MPNVVHDKIDDESAWHLPGSLVEKEGPSGDATYGKPLLVRMNDRSNHEVEGSNQVGLTGCVGAKDPNDRQYLLALVRSITHSDVVVTIRSDEAKFLMVADGRVVRHREPQQHGRLLSPSKIPVT